MTARAEWRTRDLQQSWCPALNGAASLTHAPAG